MKRRILWSTALLAALWLAACGRIAPSANPIAPTAAAEVPTATTAPTSPPATADEPLTTLATPAATRVGSEYVLLLPREAAVPAGWVMNPAPAFQTREPRPGDTYRFACLDLPARSIGVASVGYRSLEGLPSIHIEYVIYPSAEEAAAALADMQQATAECATFTIGDGDGATAAAFAPLDFPAYGDAGFAAALKTTAPASGELVTHMIKIRRNQIIAGISHANYADADPPDAALSESLAALIAGNLADAPGSER